MYQVILADDLYFFRQALKASIPWAELDMEICGEAANGEAALVLTRTLKPDIILLDINMPIMDGLTVADRIAQERLPTKMIIITGYDEFQYARRALISGVKNYILKPIDTVELIATLRKVILEIKTERAEIHVPEIKSPVHKTVAQAQKYIVDHLSEPALGIESIARHCYVNTTYLSDIFKRETGKTLITYITEQRMNAAADLLSSGFLSIAQVSSEVGFTDVGYFGKCFKKAFGVTPGGIKRKD